MRIDAHQHFWIYDPGRDRWITSEMRKIRRDFLPRDLVPILLEHDFDGCVAVQTDQSEEETNFLLKLSLSHPAIKGVVGWVDLCSPAVEERLGWYSTQQALKGFRHIVQGEADDDFMLREDFCHGISLLNKYNFTFDLLIYPQHLDYALQLVERFPDQKFVIDHLAKPSIRTGDIDTWSNQISALAAHQNVYCKLSGLVTEASWKSWNYTDLVPYIEVVCESFGTGRIIYGSDWPVCLNAATYMEQLAVYERYFRTFLDRDKASVFGNNAVEFYGL